MTNKRIVIIGASAAGKTTFAHALNTKLNLPLTLMDEVMWNPGWEYIGDTETFAMLHKVAQTEAWIIEGYITKAARADLFECADQIIYLDYPGYLMAWRYALRVMKHRKNSRAELPGSPDSFSWKFLRLVYSKGEVWKLEELFIENDWNDKIVRLKNPKQAAEFLKNI